MLKTLDSVLFTENLPTIDIHGFDRDTARVAVNDFIRDNIKQKKNIITIIHGIGSGILIKETEKVLNINPKVIEFQRFYRNTGQTIVLLDLTK